MVTFVNRTAPLRLNSPLPNPLPAADPDPRGPAGIGLARGPAAPATTPEPRHTAGPATKSQACAVAPAAPAPAAEAALPAGKWAGLPAHATSPTAAEPRIVNYRVS